MKMCSPGTKEIEIKVPLEPRMMSRKKVRVRLFSGHRRGQRKERRVVVVYHPAEWAQHASKFVITSFTGTIEKKKRSTLVSWRLHDRPELK